ncbi:hypothetical protein [Nocardia sp. NPDC002869]|uniref:hypothetical protein n=1 Tax=Nocardia sp. NPDC002869 TaxID=3161032 RepID=UPI00398CFD13
MSGPENEVVRAYGYGHVLGVERVAADDDFHALAGNRSTVGGEDRGGAGCA